MQTNRRTILSLVAMGRITPAEAERLLIAWNEGSESNWIFACCLISAVLFLLHSVPVLPGSVVQLAQIINLFTHTLGGIL